VWPRPLLLDLALNPLKISGACGRLMCCLRYEHPLYEEFAAAVPAVGAKARTPDGPGRVIAHDVPRQQVVVALDAGGRKACDRSDVCSSRRAHDAAYPATASSGCDSAVLAGPDPGHIDPGAGQVSARSAEGVPTEVVDPGPRPGEAGTTKRPDAETAAGQTDPGAMAQTDSSEGGHHRIRRRRSRPADPA
jgi:hypothetical protein